MALRWTYNKRGRDNTALNRLRGFEAIALTLFGSLGVWLAGSGFIAALLDIGKEAGVKMIAFTIIIGFIVMIAAGLIAYTIEQRRR
ncbi:MAG: hypothetical protein LBU73_06340 [Helicobacteraceae bacterium]|jgi:ABC-type antimicrobial peptide transport system permease subunit|nr:hypothetical protein [Helicobacteraceae bacterium]